MSGAISAWPKPTREKARRHCSAVKKPGFGRISGLVSNVGTGPALRRDIVVLSVRPRDGRWAVARTGRTGVRSLEGRRRRVIRAACGVAGRKPGGHHRQTRGKTAPGHRVGGRQEFANRWLRPSTSKERPAKAPRTGRRTGPGSWQAAVTRRVLGCSRSPWTSGAPVRIVAGHAVNPVWSPNGNLIVYAGRFFTGQVELLGVRPDGTAR